MKFLIPIPSRNNDVYSYDGTFVATVSEDNNLMMWNLRRVLNLNLLSYGGDRVRDYLPTN